MIYHPIINLKGTEENHLLYRTQCFAFCTVYYVLNMIILSRVWKHQVIPKSQYLQAILYGVISQKTFS
jgi:hypothetical protein